MLTFLTWLVIIAILTILTVEDPSLETMVAVIVLEILVISGMRYFEQTLY